MTAATAMLRRLDSSRGDVFWVDPTRLEESGGWIKELKDGRFRIRAKGQHCYLPESDAGLKKNKNNRRYPAATTWGRHTRPGTLFMERVRSRRVVGQLEHPTTGRSSIDKGAFVIVEVEAPDDDGVVFIIFETMSTPDGLILASYVRDRVGFGLSSRGNGSTMMAEDGVDEVQEDFEPVTWDAVVDESTPGSEVAAQRIRESRTLLLEAAGGDARKAAQLALEATEQALLELREQAGPPHGYNEYLMGTGDGAGHYRAYDNGLGQWDVWLHVHNIMPQLVARACQTMNAAKQSAENHAALAGPSAPVPASMPGPGPEVGGTSYDESYTVADKVPVTGTTLYLHQFDNGEEATKAARALEKAGFVSVERMENEENEVIVHTGYEDADQACAHVRRVLALSGIEMEPVEEDVKVRSTETRRPAKPPVTEAKKDQGEEYEDAGYKRPDVPANPATQHHSGGSGAPAYDIPTYAWKMPTHERRLREFGPPEMAFGSPEMELEMSRASMPEMGMDDEMDMDWDEPYEMGMGYEAEEPEKPGPLQPGEKPEEPEDDEEPEEAFGDDDEWPAAEWESYGTPIVLDDPEDIDLDVDVNDPELDIEDADDGDDPEKRDSTDTDSGYSEGAEPETHLIDLCGACTQALSEVSPPGWKGTVKAMKKHPEIENPWALAHWMKGKGYKSHRGPRGGKKKEPSESRERQMVLEPAYAFKSTNRTTGGFVKYYFNESDELIEVREFDKGGKLLRRAGHLGSPQSLGEARGRKRKVRESIARANHALAAPRRHAPKAFARLFSEAAAKAKTEPAKGPARVPPRRPEEKKPDQPDAPAPKAQKSKTEPAGKATVPATESAEVTELKAKNARLEELIDTMARKQQEKDRDVALEAVFRRHPELKRLKHKLESLQTADEVEEEARTLVEAIHDASGLLAGKTQPPAPAPASGNGGSPRDTTSVTSSASGGGTTGPLAESEGESSRPLDEGDRSVDSGGKDDTFSRAKAYRHRNRI